MMLVEKGIQDLSIGFSTLGLIRQARKSNDHSRVLVLMLLELCSMVIPDLGIWLVDPTGSATRFGIARK